jgi:hypothetical protein
VNAKVLSVLKFHSENVLALPSTNSDKDLPAPATPGARRTHRWLDQDHFTAFDNKDGESVE